MGVLNKGLGACGRRKTWLGCCWRSPDVPKGNTAAGSSYIIVTVWDSGSLRDDVFEVRVDGVSLVERPPRAAPGYSPATWRRRTHLKLTWTVEANDVGTYRLPYQCNVF